MQVMKLEMKEIDGLPVTGIPDGSRTDKVHVQQNRVLSCHIQHKHTPSCMKAWKCNFGYDFRDDFGDDFGDELRNHL